MVLLTESSGSLQFTEFSDKYKGTRTCANTHMDTTSL